MLNDIARNLEVLSGEFTVMAGFDGYVDNIINVVNDYNGNEPQLFETIDQFGNYIAGKAGKSCSIEIKRIKQKTGGNMPIFSKAISRLGIWADCVGAMGYPEVMSVFTDLGDHCRLHSICNPGICHALEFNDGKLMLAQEDDELLDYSLLKQRLGLDKLIHMVSHADMLAFFNWSEVKGATTIWRGFLNEVLPSLNDVKRTLFVDLSDCSRRDRNDMAEMVGLLKQLSQQLNVILSLNLNESEQLAAVINSDTADVQSNAAAIYESIGCKCLILHLTDGCYCLDGEESYNIPNQYISQPKLLTGGGDNFNAGFVFGYLNGLTIEQSLAMGNAVSGYYVALGHSPTRKELTDWIIKNKY